MKTKQGRSITTAFSLMIVWGILIFLLASDIVPIKEVETFAHELANLGVLVGAILGGWAALYIFKIPIQSFIDKITQKDEPKTK